jgi:hypothetical protein
VIPYQWPWHKAVWAPCLHKAVEIETIHIAVPEKTHDKSADHGSHNADDNIPEESPRDPIIIDAIQPTIAPNTIQRMMPINNLSLYCVVPPVVAPVAGAGTVTLMLVVPAGADAPEAP